MLVVTRNNCVVVSSLDCGYYSGFSTVQLYSEIHASISHPILHFYMGLKGDSLQKKTKFRHEKSKYMYLH